MISESTKIDYPSHDMKKMLLLLLAVILTYSYTTTYKAKLLDRDTTHFIGMTHQQLVQQFGAPVRELSYGGNGRILVFA